MRAQAMALAALLAWGCSGGRNAPEDLASTGAAMPPATPSPAHTASRAAPEDDASAGASAEAAYEFSYVYPASARAIPALKLILDGEARSVRATFSAQAEQGRDDARASGFPFRRYSYMKTWRTVSEVPGWLSLSAQVYTFTGGAHGMTFFDALVWDKAAGRQYKAADLFQSPAMLSRAIRAAFCDALDRQRAKKRGAPVKPGSTDMFDKCIDPAAETLILGSSGGKAFDRIGVLVAPYDAGPYVEGTYEVTLPVTPAVIAAARPEFRNYFALGR
jgi:hypothetical protein